MNIIKRFIYWVKLKRALRKLKRLGINKGECFLIDGIPYPIVFEGYMDDFGEDIDALWYKEVGDIEIIDFCKK